MNLNAILSISGEPINTGGGGASSWDDISDKPFSTVDTEGGLTIQDDTLMIDTLDHIATIDYVDGKIDEVEADIPSLDGYATEQYVDSAVADIDIPQPDGTTIVDNNGIWSAVGGSGSVQIDNKSLVNVNGVIQEAVPVYSEQVTTTYGPGAKFTYFEYPAGNDLDTFTEETPLLNQAQDYYNVYLCVDGVVYQGTWTAVTDQGYRYGGGGTLQMDLGFGVYGYELYMADDNSGIEPRNKIHIYLDSNLISGSGSSGNVDWLLIEPSEADASFEQWAIQCSRWGTASSTSYIYHKLPPEYYNGVQEVTGDESWNGTVQDGKAIFLRTGDAISLAHTGSSGFSGLVIGVNYDNRSIGIARDNNLCSLFGNAFNRGVNTYSWGNFTYDSTCDLFDCGEFDYYIENRFDFVVPVKDTYILFKYENNGWTAKGYESLFDSCQVIRYADPETEYNGKYYSEGSRIVQLVGPKFADTNSFEVYARTSGTSGELDYAKLNAQFLPIDNSTIRINSDGNLYSTGSGGGGGGPVYWNDILNKPTFATVSTSGSYNDLSNKPTIPTVPTDVSDFTNDAGYITSSDLSGYATETYVDDAVDHAVHQIDYSDIHGTPSHVSEFNNDAGYITSSDLPQADGTSIIDNNGVWSAASGGDWDANSGQTGYIANKPEIKTGTGTRSIVEGGSTYEANTAAGYQSHAEGGFNNANGHYSHVEGVHNTASQNQHVQGKYAYIDDITIPIYADMIGNGYIDPNTGITIPRNAEATDWDGNKYILNDIFTHVTDWSDPQNHSIKLANIPNCPTTTAGTYTLQATVDGSGNVTYTWI